MASFKYIGLGLGLWLILGLGLAICHSLTYILGPITWWGLNFSKLNFFTSFFNFLHTYCFTFLYFMKIKFSCSCKWKFISQIKNTAMEIQKKLFANFDLMSCIEKEGNSLASSKFMFMMCCKKIELRVIKSLTACKIA